MSSDRVIDYLTKQLFIDKNIVSTSARARAVLLDNGDLQVTFRSLSRALSIHVHEAKKCVWCLLLEPGRVALNTVTSVPSELAEYYSASRETSECAYATYLIVGETLQSLLRGVKEESEMDTDGQHAADMRGVMQTKILLVNEKDYESACAFVSPSLLLAIQSP